MYFLQIAGVNCGPPPIVLNSKTTVYGHSYKDNVTYDCNEGFELIGNAAIFCQVFGHWTIPPFCQGKTLLIYLSYNASTNIYTHILMMSIPRLSLAGDYFHLNMI